MESDEDYVAPGTTVTVELDDATGDCTNCEFADVEPGSTYFIEIADIGLSTIGACGLSGTAITDEDISVVGVVDPYIASGNFACGALFEISSDAEYEAELEMTFSVNSIEYPFTVTVQEEPEPTAEEEEESAGGPNLLLLLPLAGGAWYGY